MASSRARPKTTDPDAALLEALRAALDAARDPAAAASDDAFAPAAPRATRRRAWGTVVVALSGGRDSVALLATAARLPGLRGAGVRRVVAVHVHHGLSPQADAWAAHCAELCARLDVLLRVERVLVQRRGRGIEAAARDLRYAALVRAAQDEGARIVLTGHHADDRLETFLLQWMRGAGVDGLAGGGAQRRLAPDVMLVRPFVRTARSVLEACVAEHALPFVDDDSNQDTALARNALRLGVLPVMDSARPGFRAAALRSVELVAEAAAVLRAVAAEDLAHVREGDAPGRLRLDRLLGLSAARRALVLRAWLAAAGLEAPSQARLLEVLAQAEHAKSDARLLVRVGNQELRRHRGLLLLHGADAHARHGRTLQWRDEAAIGLPEWGGTLRFVATDGEGFDPQWLRAQPLDVRARAGGERFKPHAGRPSKTLKRLFQDAGIAEFERARLPLVWRGDRLIFVAGLGADVRLTDADGPRVRLEWEAPAGLV